jgi:hypothetical protein
MARKTLTRLAMKGSNSENLNIHIVMVISDGTGVTGERVVRAALTQFDSDAVIVQRIQKVRDTARIVEAIEEAAAKDALVLYSLVSPEHRRMLIHEARRLHVHTIDLLGPILRRLADVLDVSPRAEPGLFHQLDREYFLRIEAIDFAIKPMTSLTKWGGRLVLVASHGRRDATVDAPRVSGWNIANVPIVLGIEPRKIFSLPQRSSHSPPFWLGGRREIRRWVATWRSFRFSSHRGGARLVPWDRRAGRMGRRCFQKQSVGARSSRYCRSPLPHIQARL